MWRLLIIFVLLFAVPAAGQQAAPQPTPREQAMSDRLLAEIAANIEARAQVIQLQRDLVAAQVRIKDLEKAGQSSAPPH